MPVAVGDVYAFTAARAWWPMQVIGTNKHGWGVVVFDRPSKSQPGDASVVDGAPLYVIRHGRPRNMPLYLGITEAPPADVVRLGSRPVALAFELPRTFCTSPKVGHDQLPVWATWTFAAGRIEDDRAKQPPPYRSRRFPGWTSMDPRAVRAIDAAVARFATTKPATPKAAEAALRRAVKAANRHEAEIDTIAREELDAALVKIARKWKLDAARAAAIIDATRAW